MRGIQRVAGMIGSVVMGLTMVMTNTVGIYQIPLKVQAANESTVIKEKELHNTITKTQNRNLANVALGKASENTLSKKTERAMWIVLVILVVVLVSGIYVTTKSNTNKISVDDK